MVRVSQPQVAIRRSERCVLFLCVLAALEGTGRMRLRNMERLWPPLSLLLFARERSRLRILMQQRYLRMSRDSVPKSSSWLLYVLPSFPEQYWRFHMRMDRSSYAHLAGLLEPHIRGSRRRTRRAMSVDLIQKVGLYRPVHYGNSACPCF